MRTTLLVDNISSGSVNKKTEPTGFTGDCLSKLAVLTGVFLLAIVPIQAQLKTKVVVEPSKPKAMLYTTSIGVAADRWDAKAYEPAAVTLLKDAGITSLRFPGNGGTDALYHWSNNTITNPYTNEKVPVFPRERQFPAVSARHGPARNRADHRQLR